MKCQYRYKKTNGQWSKWSKVTPLMEIGNCFKHNPDTSQIVLKDDGEVPYIRHWRRINDPKTEGEGS